MYRKLTLFIALSAISLLLLVFSFTPPAQATSRNGRAKIGSPSGVSLVLQSAASRRNHAGTDFDIDMPLTAGLLDSDSGIESREGASNNQTGQDYERAVGGPIATGDFLIVLTFNNDMTNGSVGSVTVTAHNPGSETGAAGTPTFAGNEMMVPLTNVSNAQVLTLSVTNASDGTSPPISFEVNIGFAIGDTTGNRNVNASDVSQTKATVGTPITTAIIARKDVNVSGQIDSTDVVEVKFYSGTAAP